MDPLPPDDPTPEPEPVAPSPSPAASGESDAFPATPPASGRPARPRGRTLIAMVVAVALVLGGGAAATAFLVMRGSPDRIVHMIPATSDVVMTAYLDPAASQKANLFALASKFPALNENGGVGAGLNDLIDDMLSDSGLTHDDVLPWLGSQVSSVVEFDPDTLSPRFAVLIETDDEDAARTAVETFTKASNLETHSYKGVETHVGRSEGAWAIVDGAVVLASDSMFLTTIIDTSQGDSRSISDDDRYTSTIAALPESKLGFVYLNPTHFIDRFAAMTQMLGMDASAAPGLDALRAYRSVGMALSAAPDGLAVDVTIRLDPALLDDATKAMLDAPDRANALLSLIPADSYAVFSQENVDVSLRAGLDQFASNFGAPPIPSRFGIDETVASLTGDVAFEVSPGAEGPVGAAVLLGVDATGPAQKTLDEVSKAIVPLLSSAYGVSSESGSVQVGSEQANDSNKLSQGPAYDLRAPSAQWRSTTYHGTTIKYLELADLAGTGLTPAYAVLDGAAVIATDPGEIERIINVQEGAAAITSADRYVDAIAHVPAGSAAYVDVESVVSAIRQALPAEMQADFDAVAGPNLAPVKAFVTGTENSSEGWTARIFLLIQ